MMQRLRKDNTGPATTERLVVGGKTIEVARRADHRSRTASLRWQAM